MEIKAIQTVTEYNEAVALLAELDSNMPEAHALHNQIETYKAVRAASVRRQAQILDLARSAAYVMAYGDIA